ncbi:alpha/beta hydrolase [Phenylobacterium sp. LjRoot219]|uniref:lipase family protein n=1 Tax=Phenylobacterium sp. LjRoot219 TaxID=3342283 RepID=UPI003ECFD2E7
MAPRPRLTPAVLRLLALAAALSPFGPATGAAPPGLTARPPDAFYDPPAAVPARPGVLLRQEPLTDVTLPAGLRGWRILYTTTVNDRTPATAVATVFAPIDPPPGPRPVISWTHGTTGLLQRCMPSLVSTPTMGIPALAQATQAGWVIVATDYSFTEPGGPHPYLIGEGEARAALDAVRAARQMPQLTLDPRTVVWGHSQGGHAALWTGITGPRYAPEVQIVGVAAIAPVADIAKVMALNPAVDKRLGPYIARAYSRFYPDIRFEQAVRPEALAAARQIEKLCGLLPPEDPQRIAALTGSFAGPALATRTYPQLRFRLAENAANRPIAAPLLIAQGLTDEVVPPAATEAYVDARCAAGQPLEYWTLAGLDHSGLVQPGSSLSAPLAAWTAARFAGQPPARGCPRKELPAASG